MNPKLVRRWSHLFGLVLLTFGLTVAAAFAATPAVPQSPAEKPTASPTRSTLPPFEGDTAPRPVRSRSDRIISTIAPLAMVVVLVSGLYIYWLIRKGL